MLILPSSQWAIIIYRFGSFFRSESSWLPSMPCVPISSQVHHPHLGPPLLLLVPSESTSVLLLTPFLGSATIPDGAPCALSPYVLWVHMPLPRLCLLIHHRLTFHSIENFLRGQRRWCLKLGNRFPKACSSSFSRMPLLISLDPECLLSSAPFRFCSFSVEDRWGLARYLPKNCRQILFGPLSIHPNALKASQTGLWVKARHSICHSARFSDCLPISCLSFLFYNTGKLSSPLNITRLYIFL